MLASFSLKLFNQLPVVHSSCLGQGIPDLHLLLCSIDFIQQSSSVDHLSVDLFVTPSMIDERPNLLELLGYEAFCGHLAIFVRHGKSIASPLIICEARH